MVFGKIKEGVKSHIENKRREYRSYLKEREQEIKERREIDRKIKEEAKKAYQSAKRRRELQLAKQRGKRVAEYGAIPKTERVKSFLVPSLIGFQSSMVGQLRSGGGLSPISNKIKSYSKRKRRKSKKGKKRK